MERCKPGHGGRRMAAVIGVFSGFLLTGFAASSESQTPANQSDEQAVVLLPSVSFHGDAVGNDLFDGLQASSLLAHLSKEAPGSPIVLRVFHSVHPANVDAKNFFSGLLAVGTLGLSPIVMSGEHTIHYELTVNGERVARHEYSAKLSRNQFAHGKTADPTHGLGDDGQTWAKSTITLFLHDLAQDASVRTLNEEYLRYFPGSDQAPGASPSSQH